MQNVRPGTDGKDVVHKPTVRMPVDAPIPGLAIPNTREYAKQQALQILEETNAAMGDGDAPDSRAEASTQEHASLANAPDDRTGVERSRDRRNDRDARELDRGGSSRLKDRDTDSRHSHRDRDSRHSERDRERVGDRGRHVDRDRGRDGDKGSFRGSRSDRDSRTDRDRDRSYGRDTRDRGRGDGREDSSRNQPDAPTVFEVYRGRVSNTARHGAFVELTGFRNRVEGMCHVSNLANRRVNDVTEVVKRGQEVWVKVLSIQPPQAGQQRPRIDLSIRDVDQSTGRDLLPTHDASFAPGVVPLSHMFLPAYVPPTRGCGPTDCPATHPRNTRSIVSFNA